MLFLLMCTWILSFIESIQFYAWCIIKHSNVIKQVQNYMSNSLNTSLRHRHFMSITLLVGAEWSLITESYPRLDYFSIKSRSSPDNCIISKSELYLWGWRENVLANTFDYIFILVWTNIASKIILDIHIKYISKSATDMFYLWLFMSVCNSVSFICFFQYFFPWSFHII